MSGDYPVPGMPELPGMPASVRPSRTRLEVPGHSYLEPPDEADSGIEALLTSSEGYIVGRMGDQLMRLPRTTDAHLITVAPTGEGKGIGTVLPNLLDHPGSVFVVDIRGETIAKTAALRRMMGNNVVVLDPYDVTKGRWGRDTFNPLDFLDPGSNTFDDDISNLTRMIMHDPHGRMSQDPIWDNVTRILVSGAITFVMMMRPPERRNLHEVSDIFTLSPAEHDAFIAELKQAADAQQSRNEGKLLKRFLSYMSLKNTDSSVVDGGIHQVNSILDWIDRREFAFILNESTFSFSELQRFRNNNTPTTVYLVLPEERINNCATWLRLLLHCALYSLQDIYMVRGLSSSRLPQADRVLFLLDEFSAFGKLDMVKSGLATIRGRGANIWLFLQAIAQLESIYGDADARSIMSNAACLQVFGSTEHKELDYLSQVIGEEMFDVASVTIGRNTGRGTNQSTAVSETITNSESTSWGSGTQSSSSLQGTSSGWQRNRNVSQSWSQSTGRTDTQGTSTQEGESSSVSVKPEQRRIETPRNLRMKLSGNGQLLVMRRRYPFLCPRMNYLARDQANGYLFPQMVAMAAQDTVPRLLQDLEVHRPPPAGSISRAFPREATGSSDSVEGRKALIAGMVGSLVNMDRSILERSRALRDRNTVLSDIARLMECMLDLVGEPQRGRRLVALLDRATASLPPVEPAALPVAALQQGFALEVVDRNAGWLLERYGQAASHFLDGLERKAEAANTALAALDECEAEARAMFPAIAAAFDRAEAEATWAEIKRRAA